MPTILGAAASGMTLDVISHNVANANAFAFKKFRPLHEGIPSPELDPDAGRLGVAETTSDLVFSQAMTQITDNPLNFAIEDDAFLRVREWEATLIYSHWGGPGAAAEGNDSSYKAPSQKPPIAMPPLWTQPEVDPAGNVTALDVDGIRQQLGQLSFARFRNPQGLQVLGEGLYADTANTGEITVGPAGTEGFAALRPGALEGSNVDMAEEFTNMIIAQRAYSACAKTFSVGDQMLAIATNITQ